MGTAIAAFFIAWPSFSVLFLVLDYARWKSGAAVERRAGVKYYVTTVLLAMLMAGAIAYLAYSNR